VGFSPAGTMLGSSVWSPNPQRSPSFKILDVESAERIFLARSAKLPEGLYILPMFFIYFFLVVTPEPRWLRSQWIDLHQNFKIGRQVKGLDNTIELF